jgi:hypothetical protein
MSFPTAKQFSHPYKTAGTITVWYYFKFRFVRKKTKYNGRAVLNQAARPQYKTLVSMGIAPCNIRSVQLTRHHSSI